VWPFDRGAAREYLRVGALGIERWKGVDGGLALAAEHRFDRSPTESTRSIATALLALFPEGAASSVTVLLESAWLPAMLVDTGSGYLSKKQLEALVRYRMGLAYDDGLSPVAGWELRVEYRAGHRNAMAYGLALDFKQALQEAGERAGVKWEAWLPAFSWGLQRLRSSGQRLSSGGWWLWPEQDRALLARFASNHVVGLNPVASRADTSADVLRMVEVEATRLGVAAITEPIAAASWDSSRGIARMDGPVSWWSISGRAQKSSPFGAASPSVGVSA
jgi:hypothetical protein